MMLAAPDIPDPSQSWATIIAGGLAVWGSPEVVDI